MIIDIENTECRDLSELVIDTLELFRDTRESIVRAGGGNFDMSGAAWDRALQREMRADGNLHPALCTPDGHYKARPLDCHELGHIVGP